MAIAVVAVEGRTDSNCLHLFVAMAVDFQMMRNQKMMNMVDSLEDLNLLLLHIHTVAVHQMTVVSREVMLVGFVVATVVVVGFVVSILVAE